MPGPTVTIRPYRPSDEEEWLRCRVLGFLHTTYFDDVCTAKPRHDHPVAELVAVRDGRIVGLLDATATEAPTGAVAAESLVTIETVAVHPDHHPRRRLRAPAPPAAHRPGAWRPHRRCLDP